MDRLNELWDLQEALIEEGKELAARKRAVDDEIGRLVAASV